MNCSKCGFQIDDGANFCPKCGSKDMQNNLLHNEKASTSDAETTSNEIVKRENKSRSSLLIGIVLIIIVFSVGYGSYHFSVLKYTTASPEKSSKTPLKSNDNDTTKDNASLSKNEDNPVSTDKTDINKISSPEYYFFPKSESEKLLDSDVSELSIENLALARNEIFARHGYVFKSDPFESYFNNKSWYKPDPSFKGLGEEFSAIESYNVQLISNHENK
jgi:uncharacterized membrane protein YvbJ